MVQDNSMSYEAFANRVRGQESDPPDSETESAAPAGPRNGAGNLESTAKSFDKVSYLEARLDAIAVLIGPDASGKLRDDVAWLIDALDEMTDAECEPSLGWANAVHIDWRTLGEGDDREVDDEDEWSLGSLDRQVDQSHWAKGLNCEDLEFDGDEFDGDCELEENGDEEPDHLDIGFDPMHFGARRPLPCYPVQPIAHIKTAPVTRRTGGAA